MILDSEPRQRPQHIDVQIPPIPQEPPEEARGHQAAPRHAEPAPVSNSVQAQQSEPAGANAASGSPAEVPVTRSAADVGTGEKPAVTTQAYSVALMATVSADKARDMKQRLERLKLPVYTQKTPDGEKTRVRVGPFESREAAEEIRRRLIKLGFDPGKVVRKGD